MNIDTGHIIGCRK